MEKHKLAMSVEQVERMIARYTNRFNESKSKLDENFRYGLQWELNSMISNNEKIQLYNFLLRCECDVDAVYKRELDYVMKPYNAMQNSTNAISNLEYHIRYQARLEFLEEIKPYTSFK